MVSVDNIYCFLLPALNIAYLPVVIFCCFEPLIFGPGEWILRREHYFINRDWIFLYVYTIFIYVYTGVSIVYNSSIELISIIYAKIMNN